MEAVGQTAQGSGRITFHFQGEAGEALDRGDLGVSLLHLHEGWTR